MAIVRLGLTGSANGLPIGLTTLPSTIHTSTTAASTKDEVHVWVANYSAGTITVWMMLGTTGQPEWPHDVPNNTGLYLVSPGLSLSSGHVVYLRAGAVGSVNAVGFVNRLTTGA